MTFHYPYHFVPVTKTNKKQSLQPDGIAVNDILNKKKLNFANLGTACHDRYHSNTHSGTLTCILETENAIIIGGRHEPTATGPTIIHPFEIKNKPAIPASTLKGCISSLAEAASNSALRVLENKTYTRRATTHEALSAVGLIVKENGQLRLLPLALPTLKKSEQNPKYFQIPENYKKMFSHTPPRLKTYCYNRENLKNTPKSYSLKNQQFHWLTPIGKYSYDKGVITRVAKGKEVGPYLLGCAIDTSTPPINCKIEGRERVILRTFYSESRQNEIPGNKKYELALPFPEGIESEQTYEIMPEAIAKFTRLAKERDTENKRRKTKNGEEHDMLPFTLKGSNDFIDRQPKYSIQERDIVFFEPDKSGGKVAEISISQIWRKEIDNEDTQHPASTHDFFSQIDSELLPINPKRNKLSPAELLFGFVEEPDGNQTPSKMRSLLGRVKFSDARAYDSPDQGYYLNSRTQLTLNILASPKPPSPSVYFRKTNLPNNIEGFANNTCYISKNELKIDSTLRQGYIPLGRKQYLHHKGFVPKNASDNNKKLKSKVTPINPRCKFQFKVRFNNLTDGELGLLIYSLSPNKKFQHKIGMGKPLGFGSVSIRINKVELLNRQHRYSSKGLNANRFSHIYSNDCPKNLEEYLNIRKSFFAGENCSTTIQKDALELIGCNPCSNIKYGPGNQKEETYKWFSKNDRLKNQEDKQGLIPLDKYKSNSSTNEPPLPNFRGFPHAKKKTNNNRLRYQ
ncbi:hypothetical protein DGMP_11720 [Desulfomarina profundi]|uniref:CRISPR-associated protein n=1 Tax=Desulfomarina profundi TaxID=2772557 RepID=A0A8D5FLL3_9BACT|nr:TIGR03986 family CRISPR-associated RAMP protein [Desulfomarina profundi]BCL60479.1 hypothetical protein DGMP_11720 [Desulfomarina profundi]